MKIRRYVGSNAQEAILKVKMDLGNDALILNTRKVRQKGLFKIFSKPLVEVLAAVDDRAPKKEREGLKSESGIALRTGEARDRRYVGKEEDKIIMLEDKIHNMESLLKNVYRHITGIENKTAEHAKAEQNNESNIMQLFYSNLIKNEVETEIAKKIINMAIKRAGKNAGVSDMASIIYSIIAGMLGRPETIKLREDGKPTVVIFIGPTGVGKTTTLAKIAANYSLNYKKNVGLITADTYRIAAVGQLKTYAEILGIPVAVIYSPNEIRDAIERYSEKDIILIDTAGRSTRNKPQFDELKLLVDAARADEVFLVLSATTSVVNCKEIISHYSFLKDYKLIFTKVDETPVIGVILNTKCLTGRNLSYITTGQSVPDDIEVADADKLAKNLLGSIV